MAKQTSSPGEARVGDLIQTRGIHGQPPRQGVIVELLGSGARTRYRVRWEREQESILYPADGVTVIPRRRGTRHASS